MRDHWHVITCSMGKYEPEQLKVAASRCDYE